MSIRVFTEINLTKKELEFLARFVGNHTTDPVFDSLYSKLRMAAELDIYTDIPPLEFTLDNEHYPNRPMVRRNQLEL